MRQGLRLVPEAIEIKAVGQGVAQCQFIVGPLCLAHRRGQCAASFSGECVDRVLLCCLRGGVRA